MSQDRFLSRWARRKEQARSGIAAPALKEPEATPPPVAAPILEVIDAPSGVAGRGAAAMEAGAPIVSAEGSARVGDPEPAMPTLADVALLNRDSDYSRFVAKGVDEGVKQAAMKKLFSDPRFNVMDGLDTYIDDYGKPDPIPLSMLKQMNQSKYLRLFEIDEEAADPLIASNPQAPHDDADLQLQPDDAAGQPGADQGARA